MPGAKRIELLRDPIRLAFALLGPIILMAAFGYGISFDIENLNFAAFDQDNTPESRMLLQSFSGSRYFTEKAPITSLAERTAPAQRRITVRAGVPSGFGRDLQTGRQPEVDATVDGAMTFQGETAKNYVLGVIRQESRAPGRRQARGQAQLERQPVSRRAFATIRPSRASTP